MAAASNFLSEDQFLCSICLDVFTHPVTTPCGHNFCKNCITEHWNTKVQSQCPMCNKCFDRRPELHVNTFISEMAAQFRQSCVKDTTSCSEQKQAKSAEVLCDVCTETKLKAVKSCLVCLASYCETHLEPHQRIPGLKKHKLIDPVKNLEDRMCKKHDRPLELFCKTDHTCVCRFCTETSHKRHHIVSLKDEYEGKKATLGETEAEIQKMIRERQVKIWDLKHSMELSKEEKQAEGFIKELEEDISELMKRNDELQHLLHAEDHLQFLQSFPSLNSAPPSKDWTEVRLHSSYEGTVRRAVAQLEETHSKEMKRLLEAELKMVQQYAVNVTVNQETAHPKLIISHNGKEVSHGEVKQNLQDNPGRFSSCCGVLGKQGFTSGRFYYEVRVKGKTDWTLGVARESINRKGEIKVCPRNGYWTVWLRKGNVYHANTSPPVLLSPKLQPQKVGVFVDYKEGLVSFYDVDAADLIYSFTGCKFKEKLFPYFSPCSNDGGKNSTPLIISPVGNTYLNND
ncbi:zinc-binding protein A33-like isoform X2 [Scomber scombrus]|uniref:zinc-binding protein A33-like isoform X2 n=1 Tax=Scomber scombrus TaxID=13677 RepID=UPI002DD94A46|nr:zinc-binding protein A33-like isoform X2 [Scomber scombrus]